MRLVILDNALHDIGSHAYNNAAALVFGMMARGVLVEVFGCGYVDPKIRHELGVVQHFKRSFYEPAVVTGVDAEQINWERMNLDYCEDLLRLPQDVWTAGTVVLHPCISQFQLFGLAQFLKIRGPTHAVTHIVVPIFYPNWTAWGGEALHANDHYKRAYHALALYGGGRVHVFSETLATAKAHQSLLEDDVNIMPAPVRIPPTTDRKISRHTNVPLIGFFGYAKLEKGFHLLPEAIAELKSFSDASFIVQSQHDRTDYIIEGAEKKLHHLDNVRMIESAMDRAAYFAAFDEVDIVAVPYDPKGYRERGSAVVSEAVALGKPIVTSPGTWAADAISLGVCAGIIMRDWSPSSLAEAWREAINNLEELQAKAMLCSSSWRTSHSYDASCEILMPFIKDANVPFSHTYKAVSAPYSALMPAEIAGVYMRLLASFSKSRDAIFDILVEDVPVRRVRDDGTSLSIDIPLSLLKPGQPVRFAIGNVTGDVDLPWERLTLADEQMLHEASLYRLGEGAVLLPESRQVLFLGGWGKFEKKGRWSNGQVSELVLTPAQNANEIALNLDMKAPPLSKYQSQQVEIWAFGKMIAERELARGSNKFHVVLRDVVWRRDRPVTIRIFSKSVYALAGSQEIATFFLSSLSVDPIAGKRTISSLIAKLGGAISRLFHI